MKKTIATALLLITLGLAPAEAFAERLFMNGWEWQLLDAEENNSNGNYNLSTSIKNGGAVSTNLNSVAATNSKYVGQAFTTLHSEYYLRFYIYVDTLVASANNYVGAGPGNSTFSGYVRLYDSGGSLALDVYDTKGGTQITDTASVAYDTWHRIEMYAKTNNAGATDILTVRVDGVEVATASNLTLSDQFTAYKVALFNDSGSVDNTSQVYVDDVAINLTTGTAQISWPGAGKIVAAVPNAAGVSACNSGLFGAINEIPASDSNTGSTDRCALTTNGGITGMFNVTDSSTLGIDSFDTITLVQLNARVIKASSLAANWFPRISDNGTTNVSGSTVDLDNAVIRTNPSGTTARANTLFAYTNPATSLAWTPTGTNSIDNMQIGVGTTDANPDVFVTTLAAMVEYVDGVQNPYVPLGPLYYSVGRLILSNGKFILQ